MVLTKNTHTKVFISSITILTFLYSQILWAAGYELFKYTLDEEGLITHFRSPEEAAGLEAREKYLLNRQQEIDRARRLAFNWSYPLHEPNRELSRNLAYQEIMATRALTEGKRYADEITGRIGAYGKYYIKHKDGMVTWYFNALLTDIIGEKIKDKLGHQSIQDTIQMLYNEKRQLISFNQKIKDERGNVTTKIWDSATYWMKEDMRSDPRKEKGTLASYHEEITYPTGETIDRRVANLTYYTGWDETQDPVHIEDQIASYDEIKLSNQAPSAPTSTHWFDSGYLKRPHTYTLLDPFDEDKYPDEDERYDILLTGFKEDSTTLDVTTTRVWSNPVYNEHEQITSYHESIDSLGFHTERDFYDAKYDDWGRLTSYRERIDTEGLVTERYWHSAQYNNIDQLTYYKEDLFSGGVWTYTTWDNPVYNSIGQLISYHTVTESGGIEIDTTRSNIIYNEYGLPSSYDEVVKSLGMTITTNRRNITYDLHGWITGWTDTIREVASYVDDNGPVNIDRVYTLRRYDMTYYWNGLVSGYRELLIDPLGISTSTYRYEMRYNRQGLLIYYIEEITKTGLGMDIWAKTIRDSITYNSYGQMTGYHETMWTDEASGLITETTRSGIKYNNEGWVTEYTEEVHKYGEDKTQYDITVTTRRYDIVYNRIGKPTKYKEEITNELGTKVTKDWWGGEYNPVGLLTSFYEKATYPDRILETQQYQIVYDPYDRIIGYIQKDTDQFRIITDTTRSNIKYNGQNIIQYHEDIIRLNQRWQKDWFGALYDKKNHLVEYKEKTEDPFEMKTTLRMYSMDYNPFGQLVGYIGITTRDDDLDYTSTRIWTDARYNSLNQLNTFCDVNTITDGAITLKTETMRILTGYNSLGYVTEYEEGVKEPLSSGDKTTKRHWHSAEYGEKGLLLSYAVDEDSLGVNKKTIRGGITYNSLGQETGYTDTITETNQPDKVTTIERSGILYSEDGRLKEYQEEYNESGLGLNYTRLTSRYDISYDKFGNQLSYTDTITESSAPDYITTKEWSGEYNSLGLITSSIEETHKGDRPKIVVIRSGITYNQNGLQMGYLETTTDYATPLKPTTKRWQADSHNTYGQLIGYTELIDEGLPTQKKVIRKGMVYTKNLLTYYNENIEDSTTPDKRIDNTWSANYNTLGQISSYIQKSAEKGINWDKTITQERKGITYDSQGREYSYTQTYSDSSSSSRDISTNREKTFYNGNGLLSNYIEFQSQMDYTIKTERRDIKYNKNEQLLSYIEETTNSGYPDKLTVKGWESSGYNGLGQLTGDIEVTVEKDSTGNNLLNLTSTTTRTGLKYDDRGGLIEYSKTEVSDTALDIVEKTYWNGEYNGLGLLVRYEESTQKGDRPKVVVTRNTTYDSKGLQIGYIETSEDYATPDKTTTKKWKADSYNGYAQLIGYSEIIDEGLPTQRIVNRADMEYKNDILVKYNERIVDSTTPDKTIDNTWSAGYNRLGQINSYTQTSIEKGTNWDKTIIQERNGITYDIKGREYIYTQTYRDSSGENKIITTDRKETFYNGKGLTNSFKESQNYKGKDGENMDYTLNRQRTNIEYNNNEQIVSYIEELSNSEYPDKLTRKEWMAAGYNGLGQLTGDVEITSVLSLTTTTTRTGLKYDDRGNLIEYNKTEVSDSAPDLMEETYWRSEYNGLGLQTNYEEVETNYDISTNGNNLKTIKKTKRENIDYNNKGQALSYLETVTESDPDDSSKINKTTITEWADGKYDKLGQLSGYSQTITETAEGFNIRKGLKRYDISYLDSQVVGYIEEEQDNITPNKTTILKWGVATGEGITYNKLEQLSGYTETYRETGTDTEGNKIDRTKKIQYSDVSYNDKGQIYSYNTITTNPDGLVETLKRIDTVYNKLGQITYIGEEITKSTQPGITTTHTFSDAVYNRRGLLISYSDIVTDSYGAGQRIKLSNIQYNGNGQIVSYHQESKTQGITTITDWSNGTYNASGQLISFHEESTTFGVKTIRDRADMKYNDDNLLIEYIETRTDTPGKTTKIVWGNAVYDLSGNLYSYKEIVTRGKDVITYNRTETKYNSNNLISEYKETITSDTSTIDIHRYDINYNESNLLYSYKENKTHDGFITETEWGSPVYNSDSQLLSYAEKKIIDGLTIETRRSDMEYNKDGQLSYYKDLIHRFGDLSGVYKYDINSDGILDGEGLDTWEIVERKDITYQYGNINTFNEYKAISNSIGEWIGPVTNTQRISTDYLDNGDLTSYEEKITTGIFSNGIFTPDNSVIIDNLVSGIELDVFGRQVYSKTKSIITGTLTEEYRALGIEDAEGGGLNQTKISDKKIDKLQGDRVLGYTENIYDTDGSTKLTTIKGEDISYNNLGQVWSSKDSIYTGDSRILSIEKIKANVYDRNGQLIGNYKLREDASLEEPTPWIKYTLSSSAKINKTILINHTNEEIKSGRLVFSDDSILYFNKLAPGGSGLEFDISEREVDSIIFQVIEGDIDTLGNNDIEIQAYYIQKTKGEDINLALDSSPTASSEYSAQYSAWKVIDGSYGIWDSGEWASRGEKTPWIQFNWNTHQRINRINLYSRPNEYDQIYDARLLFSDGSVIKIGMLSSGSLEKEVFFPEKDVTWVRLEVLEAGPSAMNIGLSEFQAYYIPSDEIPKNLAQQSTITASSFYPGYNPSNTVDNIYGIWDYGEWASNGESNPWIKYAWDTPQEINKIIISDRPNKYDNIQDASLIFSDGSVIKMGPLPSDGSAREIFFDKKTVNWVKLEVTDSTGPNPGISELQVQYIPQAELIPNISSNALINVSSEYSSQFSAGKTVDGIYGQWNNGEWASAGEKTPWIRYNWATPQDINKIILYNRPNSYDEILDSVLEFSDGSSIHVGILPMGGAKKEITFPTKNVSWVEFKVLKAGDSAYNIGLAEFQAQYIYTPPPQNLAQNALIDSSSEHISGVYTEQWNYDIARNEKSQVIRLKSSAYKHNIVPLTVENGQNDSIRNIDQWLKVDLLDMTYNNLGQLYSYKKIDTSPDNKLTIETIRNITIYDSSGLESGYSETINEKGEELDVTNQIYRYNILYNNIELPISYNEQITNSYENLIYTKKKSPIGYNELRQLYKWNEEIETEDTTGAKIGDYYHTKTGLSRIKTFYNQSGMEKEYEEEMVNLTFLVDGEEKLQDKVKTTTSIKEIIYDTKNRLESFIRRDTYTGDGENGKLNYWVESNLQISGYNNLGQIEKYTETITTDVHNEVDTNTYTIISYDKNGRRKIYTIDSGQIELEYDNYGSQEEIIQKYSYTTINTKIESWDYYYHRPLLIKKTITTEDENGNQLCSFNIEITKIGSLDYYNDLVQGYNIKLDIDGDEIEQRDIKYNEKGQVVTYKRKSGGETTEMEDAQYNSSGRLISYKEKISNNEYIEWKDAAYNDGGRLLGYKEVQTENEKTDTRIWEEARYDKYWRLTHYKETKGNNPSTEWDGATFDDKGQYIKIQPLDVIYVPGIDVLPQKPVLEPELNPWQLALKSILDMLDATMDTMELTVETFTPFIQSLKSLAVQVLYNLSLGMQAFHTTITKRTSTEYNELSLAISFKETIIEIGGSLNTYGGFNTTTTTKEVERKEIKYNEVGQVTGYQEIQTNQLGLEKKIERTDIVYTEFGLVESYSEKTLDLGIEKSEDVSNLTYNEKGQLVAYHSVLKESATSLTESGTPIKYEMTTVTERLWTEYGIGGLVVGLAEKIWSSATPSITTSVEKAGITYNPFGRVSGLIEKVTEKGEDLLVTTITKRSNLQYTPVGNLLSFQEEITSSLAPDLVTIRNWSGAAYSPRGELIGYTETIQRKGSDLIKQMRKTGITYDILGRVTGYKLIERELGVTKTTIRKDIIYNPLHQLLGYEEIITAGGITEQILFSGAEYDITGKLLKFTKQTSATGQSQIVQHRLSTVYNDYGQVIAYDDKITKLDLTQLLSVKLQYNILGQTLGYTQESHTIGGPLDYTETTTRANSTYDSFGRLRSYDESDLSTIKHVIINYNTYDQLTKHTETGTRYGDAYQYKKDNMQYDTQNRLSTYNEISIGVAEQSSATIELTYNDLNQMTARHETGTDRKGAYTLNTTDIKYTDLGQQKSYTQEKTQNGITTTTTRIDTTYNEKTGLVSIYSETTESPLGKSTRGVEVDTYDNKGRMSGYTENGTNEDGSTYKFTRDSIQYDDKQRIKSFNETGNNSQTGDYRYKRNSISYDNLNRITGYEESGRNSQSGLYKFDKSIEYEGSASDQIKKSSEKNGWRENGGNYWSEREIKSYDSLDRATDFTETGWTQGQGSYNLHRHNIQYGVAEQSSAPISYTEDGWQEGKGTYHTEKSNIQYEKGRLKGFHEKTSSSDGSTIEFDRAIISYHDNGLLKEYTDDGDRTGAGHFNFTRSNIQYHGNGQIKEYRESGSNWDGSYNYHRHSINYHSNGNISEYRENGTDTKGKGYSLHRYNMQYHGNGLLASYSENSNEGHRDIWNMSYDGNGTLVRQEVRTDKDQFQFGGHSTYSFSYDSNGNLTQTRIDTNDYWVTFDAKGNQTGFGYSAQMQNYINELQRQAEEAEREAEWAMRDAEDKINEAVEAERMAMEEEMAATVVRTETITVKRGKNKYDVVIRYWYADGSYTEDVERVKGKSKAKQKAEEARRRSQELIGQAREKVEQAKRRKEEAERQADRARGQAGRARERAEESKRAAESRRAQAISTAAISREKAEKAKEQAIKAREKVTTTTTATKIEITRTKNSDGSTTVILTNKITGARRELRFDSYGDLIYKKAQNYKGEIIHYETHNYTRDSRGRITSDTYHKETLTYNDPQKIKGPPAFGHRPPEHTQQTRDRVIEDGTINYNKWGQITGADITRTVKTELSTTRIDPRTGDVRQTSWREIANYTMEIKITTTQDSMGRVVSEQETTHIFGKEAVQTKGGGWKTEQVDYTITRDRTYNYEGSSPLPSGWHEKITQSNLDLTIERDVFDIAYNDRGQMTDYRVREHEYGTMVKPDGKTETIDVIREYRRYDVVYNDKNQITSYREDRWSSDKPGLVSYAYVHDITYNSAGLMESYIEELREIGWATAEGKVYTGLAPPTGLEEANRRSLGTQPAPDMVFIDRTTITHRTNIKYNGLNQITGYTDNITRPDGKQETATMSGITYWADGRMKGYTQTTTGPDDEGKIKTHTTTIYSTTYDRLGRIDEKYGTYDGKAYKWKAISYDELGRPTAYKEKIGKVSYRHYDIIYNELGDVVYEKIKVTAKSGGLIKSKTTVLTEYWYGYDEYGQHEKIKENEIYRKTTKSFIAKVFDVIDAVLKIASIFLPILKPFSFVFSLVNQVLQTGDIKGVLLQLAAQAIGAALGGMLTAEGAAGGLADFFGQFDITGAFNAGTSSFGIGAVFKIFNVIDDLVGDLTGESLTQRMFGENAGIARAIFGVLGNLFSPDGMNAYNLIAGLGSIGLEILKRNNPEFAQSDLGKFLFSMVDQALNTWATIETREAKAKDLQKQLGADGITRDKYNRPTGVYKDSDLIDGKFTREYYNLEGEYLGSVEYSLYDESIGNLNIDGSFGGITIYDKDGNKLYESKLDKSLLDYDSFGKGFDSRLDDLSLYPNNTGDIIAIGIQEGDKITVIGLTGKLGTMPVNATPMFNSEGKLLYSELHTDIGTISFDLEGNYAGFTPNGFTPVRLEDTIAYSYLPVSENSFLMVDSNGGNLKLVTQKLDSMGIPIGEYITDDTSIAYYDSRGIKLWDRANQVNSTINLYLEDGSVWGEITTLVTESNLVSSYLFNNKLTGETSLYDWAGTLDSMTDARGDFYQYNEKGEVVLYVPEGFDVRRDTTTQQVIDVIGYDDKGNFISQDPKGRLNYKVTAEGDTYLYGIDGRLNAIMYGWDTDADNIKTFTYFDQFDDIGNLIGSSRISSDGVVTILDPKDNEVYSFNLAEIQQDIVQQGQENLADLVQDQIQNSSELIDKVKIIPEPKPVELIPVPQPLLEKLITLIQNIPQSFSNITDNLLDLITTPAFANNGEAQAQVLMPIPSQQAITLKDRFLDPLKQAGKEYVEGVNKFNNAVKTLWNKWSDLVTPEYGDNTSTWTNFWNEIVNGDPLKTAGQYYWDPLVEAKNELIDGANKIINSTKATVNTIKEFGNYLKDEFKTGMSEVAELWNGVKEQYEKTSNFYKGFGFRTDEQIAKEKALEVKAAKLVGQSGDIVSASGDEWWAFYIKASEMTGLGDKHLNITSTVLYPLVMTARLFSNDINKPISNHTGMLIRLGDEVYVMEIDPGGFRLTPIDKFAEQYKDITIMRPSNESTPEIANSFFESTFDQITLEPIGPVPGYNYFGLIGIGNVDSLTGKNAAICSELVCQGLDKYSDRIPEPTSNPLTGVIRDNRVSPYDIDYASPLWDENILDIYYRDYVSPDRRN